MPLLRCKFVLGFSSCGNCSKCIMSEMQAKDMCASPARDYSYDPEVVHDVVLTGLVREEPAARLSVGHAACPLGRAGLAVMSRKLNHEIRVEKLHSGNVDVYLQGNFLLRARLSCHNWFAGKSNCCANR